MQFFRETNIDFLGKKFFALGLSLIVVTVCAVYVTTQGLPLGIDFEGGNMVQLKFQEMPSLDDVRATLAEPDVGYGNAILQADRDHNEIIIRVKREKNGDAAEENNNSEQAAAQESVAKRITQALMSTDDVDAEESGKLNLNLAGKSHIRDFLYENDPLEFRKEKTPEEASRDYWAIAEAIIDHYREQEDGGDGIITDKSEAFETLQDVEVIADSDDLDKVVSFLEDNTFAGSFSQRKAEMVSADVGAELGTQALWAILFSLGGILAYIWFRFNPRFAVAAIAALVHDVCITVGFYSMSGREFNLPIVAAVLTIVGYSLNDTIVVFDRIRENLTIRRREAKENYEGVLNSSINQTLSRTLLTSLTTLIVLFTLLILGGASINDFAFMLMLGVLVGTYSSIFVASPVLSIWQRITGTMGGELGRTKLVKV